MRQRSQMTKQLQKMGGIAALSHAAAKEQK